MFPLCKKHHVMTKSEMLEKDSLIPHGIMSCVPKGRLAKGLE